jgi:hypothetical protein
MISEIVRNVILGLLLTLGAVFGVRTVAYENIPEVQTKQYIIVDTTEVSSKTYTINGQ